MRRILIATCTLLGSLAFRTPPRSDFVDTRLNFTLTDENLLAKPGETQPSVPGVRIGSPELARNHVFR